jgi:hypothetical protein
MKRDLAENPNEVDKFARINAIADNDDGLSDGFADVSDDE